MKKKNIGKKGQIKMSFNMIFSIILIIAFIGVAIYAVTMFLGVSRSIQEGRFKDRLKRDVERAWTSEDTSIEFVESLPSSIEYVCFIDTDYDQRGGFDEQYEDFDRMYVDEHIFYWPFEGVEGDISPYNIDRLNMSRIIEDNNPQCFENDNDVSFIIEKRLYENLVNIG